MTGPPRYHDPGQPGYGRPERPMGEMEYATGSEPSDEEGEHLPPGGGSWDRDHESDSPDDAGGFAGGAPPLGPENDPPPQAHARRTDPETSHEAAASVTSSKIRASQHAVRQLLLIHGPMTDHQIRDAYPILGQRDFPRQSDSGLRSRRAELVAMKPPLVRWTGRWHKEPGRRRSRVWEVVE